MMKKSKLLAFVCILVVIYIAISNRNISKQHYGHYTYINRSYISQTQDNRLNNSHYINSSPQTSKENIVFVPELKTDILALSKYLGVKTKNRYWYSVPVNCSFPFKSCKNRKWAHTIIHRTAWIDTRPGIHDTPCIRLPIFSTTGLTQPTNVTARDYYKFFQLLVTTGAEKKKIFLDIKQVFDENMRVRAVYRTNIFEYLFIFNLHNNISIDDINTKAYLFFGNDGAKAEVNLIKPQTPTKKQNFVACVQVLYGKFPTKDENFFIEWVEFYRMMGVSEIHMYNSSWVVSPRMQSALDMYNKMGVIYVHDYQTPFYALPSTKKLRDKSMSKMLANIIIKEALQSCTFANLHRFKYLLSVDLDELVVPSSGSDYTSITNNYIEKSVTAIMCQWRYYYPFYYIPPETQYHQLKSMRYRTYNWDNDREHVKSFINLSKCAFGNCHFCASPLERQYRSHEVCATNHYRDECRHPKHCKNKKSQKRDESILRFEGKLAERCNKTADLLPRAS